MSPISFADHVELKILVKEMTNYEVTSMEEWKKDDNFGRIKYKLHQ